MADEQVTEKPKPIISLRNHTMSVALFEPNVFVGYKHIVIQKSWLKGDGKYDKRSVSIDYRDIPEFKALLERFWIQLESNK